MRYLEITLFLVACFCSVAFAEEVAQPTYLDGVLKWISQISPGVLAAVLAVVADIAVRVWKTSKPLSLLIPVKYAVVSLKKILGALENVLEILIDNFNRLKPPQ